MNKKIFASLILVIAVAALGYLWIHRAKDSQSADGPTGISNQKIIDTITRDQPIYLSENKPVIDVVSTKELQGGWIIATIKSIHEDTITIPVRVVLLDQGEPDHVLKVVLGPDVHFTESDMTEVNLPDDVILELRKS